MAMSAEGIASAHGAQAQHGGAEATTPSQPRPEQRVFARFSREDFVNVGGTGQEVTDRGRVTGERREQNVELTEGTKDRYGTFLRTQIKRLVKLSNGPVSDTIHPHEQVFLNEFAKFNPSGRIENVTDAEVDEYLKNPEGWMNATQLMEEQIMYMENAFGVYAAANPAAQRENLVGPQRIYTDINRGWLNRQVNDRLIPNLGRIGRALGYTGGAVGAGTVGAGIAVATGSPAWAGAVMGVATIGGAVQGIRSLMREGVTVDLRQCTAAFQLASGDLREAAYMKEMTGIDVADFQENGRGGIELRPGRSYETTRPADSYRNELMDLLDARQKFYEGLGVDTDALDASPEQYLHQQSGQGFRGRGRSLNGRMVRQGEQTGTWWQQEMQQRFNPNRGGILSIDAAGALQPVEIQNPLTGEWQANGNFNPNRLDYQGNLRRFMEARRGMIADTITESARERERAETAAGDRALFNTRRTNLTEARTRQSQADIDRAGRYDKDKSSLVAERNTLNGYSDKVDELRIQQERTEAARTARRAELLTEVINPGGGAYPNVNAIRADLRGLLGNTIPNLIIDGMPMESPQARINTARTARNGILGTAFGGPPDTLPAYQARIREAQTAFERVETQAQEDIRTINAKIRSIDDAVRAPAAEATVVITPDQIRQATELTTQLTADYNLIRDLDGLGGVDLSDVMLQTGTVEDVMQQITLANQADPDRGWPENQQNDETRRMQVVRAMTEARARLVNDFVETPPASYTMLIQRPGTATPGYGITEHQLLTQTPDQIRQLVEARRTTDPIYAGLTALGIDDVRAAQTAAQYRLAARVESMTEMDTFLDNQKRIADAAAKAVTIDQQTQAYDLAGRIMDRQASAPGPDGRVDYRRGILPRANRVSENNFSLIDATPIDPADPAQARRYIAAEQVQYDTGGGTMANLPRGYLEMMNTFFDYSNQPRQGPALEQAMRILPPARLAELLDQSLNIPRGIGAPPARTDLAAVLTDVRNGFNVPPGGRRQLSERNMRNAFLTIIDTIRDETRAIAA